MKLEYVITSCNLNKLYCDFIPIFVKAWKKLIPDIKIRIILIAEKIPEEYQSYDENIILFPPIENITTSFISQYIRLLYPAILNSEGGVLITDMDMLPMNSDYYIKSIEDINNDKFIYYRDFYHPTPPQYCMCYNIATSKIWSEIFDINNIEDIIARLKERFSNFWCRDQEDLYIYINKWKNKEKDFVMLNDNITNYNRICRSQFRRLNKRIINNIQNKIFTDYHALRPNEGKNKEINEKIIELL